MRWLSRRGERGLSMSLIVVGCLPVLVLALGLVVDGGRQLAAQQQAEVAAQTAARAGADASAPDRAAGRSNAGAAVMTARQALAGSGVTGTVTLVGGRLQVRTEVSRPTVFLSVVGLGSVTGSGLAEADLVASGTQVGP